MPGITYEKKVLKNNPELYHSIIEFCKENKLDHLSIFKQKEYHYQNSLKEIPLCLKCGKGLRRFQLLGKGVWGYNNYCSEKCSKSSDGALEKRKKFVLEKYGVDNVSKSEKVKDKITKTFQEKYGVNRPSQLPEIVEKQQKTMLKNYGVKVFSQSKEILDKMKENYKEKHGVDHWSKTEGTQKKIKKTNLKKYGKTSYLATEENREKLRDKEIQDKAKETRKNTNIELCGYEFWSQNPESIQKARETFLKNYGVDWITKTPGFIEKTTEKIRKKFGVDYGCLLPRDYYKASKGEKELRNRLNGKQYIVDGRQYDIRIENTIIEVDGEYWHVDDIRDISFTQLENFLFDYLKEFYCLEKGFNFYRIKYKTALNILKQDTLTLNDVIINSYKKNYDQIYKLKEIITKKNILKSIEKYGVESLMNKVDKILLVYNEMFLGELYRTAEEVLLKEYEINIYDY